GGVSLCHPGWSAVVRSQVTATCASQVQAILLSQPSSSWDYRRAPTLPVDFLFLVETRFHHVGQAGLELLTSSDPPASASQSGGITATGPLISFLISVGCILKFSNTGHLWGLFVL
uniref:Uncharacterized protein n=1 Tax=Macaca mulatta TaxID=9544 RepID=A0A5F8ASG7_MACMU